METREREINEPCGKVEEKTSLPNSEDMVDYKYKVGEKVYYLLGEKIKEGTIKARMNYPRRGSRFIDIVYELEDGRFREECTLHAAKKELIEILLDVEYEWTMNDFQQATYKTCVKGCSADNLAYMYKNLLGEVGELVAKIESNTDDKNLKLTEFVQLSLGVIAISAKEIRKGGRKKDVEKFAALKFSPKELELISKELGDILWQVAGLARVLGLNLNDIAQQNQEKLLDRLNRNAIEGDGDER